MPDDPKRNMLTNLRKDITDLKDSLKKVEELLEFKIEALEEEKDKKKP